MKAPTALIAEDEPVLAQALQRQLKSLWPALVVADVARDGQQACELAMRHLPDILFMDIHMPALSGLEAIEHIVDAWPIDAPLPLLVFITAYDEYAVQAFERAAIDYVLKPVRAERLALTCQRLQAQLGQRAQPDPFGTPWPRLPHLQAPQPHLRVLQAASGSSVYVIALEDVLYLEAADKYVRVVTQHDDANTPERLIRTPLRELMPRLDDSVFWQVHRSHVVNVRAIERISRQDNRTRVHLRGRPETIDVSRMHAHLFKAM